MRKTAIILAGAAAFDLGVMVLASRAQQAPLPPSSFSTGGSGGQSRAGDMFLKIDAALSQRACIARRGEVVMHEGSEQCRLPGPSGSASPRGAPEAGTGTSGGADIHKHDLALNYLKIDIHYTARACIARRGEVVMHQGIQQCRLPATARSQEANQALGQVSTTR